MTEIEIQREVPCRAAPEVLWPLVADTARLNRIAGMSPLELSPVESESGARYLVRTRLDGIPVAYEEEPFEWESPGQFIVRRNMKEGALHRLQMALELRPGPNGGSIVTWRLIFSVKLALIAPITRLLGNYRMGAIARATERFDAEALGQAPALPPVPPGPAQHAVATLEQALDETDRPLARRLGEWVAGAPDTDVSRIRPYDLADRWGVARERVLGVCLEAVVAGLLQMYWDLVCPSCQTGSSRVEHLFELTEKGHCGYCDISFDLPLDRAVEAVFVPSAGVRKVDARPYCTGGPAATPHVIAQRLLPAGGEVEFNAPGAAGAFRVFARGGAQADVQVVAGAQETLHLQLSDTIAPEAGAVRPGGKIRVRQSGGVARHVKLEQAEWVERAATAHRLSLQPRFRRIFSGEVLGPGRQLHVARVALLFSDLSASTALYSRVGDAPAFRLVQDHFEHLRACIAAENGVVVKTIGDAVMAAFPEEGAAMRCAVAMQTTWDGFRQGRPDAVETMLKIGVHAGPAYVVTANGVLDYFGQTVNIAARLQGAAHEREIVVVESLADRAATEGWLSGAQVTERFDAVLKGLDRPLRSARIAV
jgi:class 3 adenylate cyclase